MWFFDLSFSSLNSSSFLEKPFLIKSPSLANKGGWSSIALSSLLTNSKSILSFLIIFLISFFLCLNSYFVINFKISDAFSYPILIDNKSLGPPLSN